MNSQSGSNSFDARGQSFEEAYFRSKDAEMVDKLRKVFDEKRDKEELGKATGITNDEVLTRLMNINVRGEMLTVFNLYPLVEIAWADGSFDQAEGEAALAVQQFDLVGNLGEKRAVDAGADFIQQDNPRLAHQRAAKFKQFLLPA